MHEYMSQVSAHAHCAPQNLDHAHFRGHTPFCRKVHSHSTDSTDSILQSHQQVKNVYDQKVNSPGMANSSQLFLRYVKCQCNNAIMSSLCVNVEVK